MKTAQATTALFVFWLVLTGSFAPVELISGALLSVALGAWGARVLWPEDSPAITPRQALRFVLFIPHLLASVLMAALQVAEVVLDPRMPIEPHLMNHRTSFTRPASRVLYANSITLTPGTITVDVDDDTFCIHCLAERFADEIATGELEDRVAHVFEG
ncbi:MAG: Na+/H+ antiporter subunit E [Myxococcota bacterium]|nr:Na+/H+ antiporter subunit E [Myxococcota bacterium]